ncbi:MAG: hypothetical protein GF408_03705 [Candidatus Omnitrophica bacterium]|nr:hypothetical protein [Candidatus Omnitrophota bacterium]
MEIFRKIYRILEPVVRKIQQGIAFVLLGLLYIFGFGFAWLLSWAFKREMVRRDLSGRKSYWEEARGYGPDPEKSLRQS